MQTLQYAPGQLATVFMQVIDNTGMRQDGYVPSVVRVLFPDLSVPSGFPHDMTRIDVGLYYFQFTLPATASAVGSYLVDILYQDPDTLLDKNAAVQILVSAPFGLYTAIPTG